MPQAAKSFSTCSVSAAAAGAMANCSPVAPADEICAAASEGSGHQSGGVEEMANLRWFEVPLHVQERGYG